jgi:hypothetical protein
MHMNIDRLLRNPLSAVALAAFLFLGAQASRVESAPVCVDPEGAIGGTGKVAAGSIGGTGAAQGAVGGTGQIAGAIGGTGQVAGAIGGTGAPQGAIGGTGQVAAGSIGGTGAPAGSIGGTGQVAGAVGGTGVPEGAVGGTGSRLNGGIGGTGAPVAKGIGGTGIVGTITGFASVCVNGLEVHFDDSTPVDQDGRATVAGRLAVGQVVAIEAEPSSRGLQARRISVMHAVAGPITAIDQARGRVQVMNQTVRLDAITRIAGPDGSLRAEALQPGTLVAVSGQRDSRGEIVATRIEREDSLPEHVLIGRVGGAGRDDAGEVSGTPVQGLGSDRRTGDSVMVKGRWTGDGLRASEVDVDPVSRTVGRTEHVVLEGYVHRSDRDAIEVAGQSIALSAGTRISGDDGGLAVDRRIVVSGRVDRSGRISAERIEIGRDGDTRRGSGDARGRSAERKSEDASREDRDASSGRERSDDDQRADRSSSEGSGSEREADSGSDRRGGSDNGDTRDVDRTRIDRSGPDRVERAEKAERVERVEKIEKVEKVERVEKIERVEKPEKVERVEVPSAVDRVERPETTSGKSRK